MCTPRSPTTTARPPKRSPTSANPASKAGDLQFVRPSSLATAPASHYHLEQTRPWAHTATVGAAVPRMAEFPEKELRPFDANSIQRGLQSSTRGDRFPVSGSARATTGHDLSEHLAITGRGHQR